VTDLRALRILTFALTAFAWCQLFGLVTRISASSSLTATQTPASKPSPAIFVTNPAADSLSVFPIGSNGNVPSLFTQTFLSNPVAITYWRGELYVANGNSSSVTAYPANGDRRPNPIININGEKTQLVNPAAIAVDSAGNIYVANQGILGFEPASITIYAAGSNGDVAPIRVIKGPRTGLKLPDALTVDSLGGIYVSNQTDSLKQPDSISIYSPESHGDVAPPRIISGSSTELSSPGGIALDPSGNIYVTSRGDKMIPPSHIGVLIFAKGSAGNVAPITS
jgi:hypothetical protein